MNWRKAKLKRPHKTKLEANQALLLDGPLSEQPQIQSAVSNLKQAWLNLERTKIRSPIKGYVARRNAQVGQAVSVGGALIGSGDYRSNVVRCQLQRKHN